MLLLPTSARTLVAILHDAFWIIASWIMAFWFRQGLEHGTLWATAMATVGVVTALQLSCFFGFGLYRGIWRYSSLTDLRRIAIAVGTSALLVPTSLLIFNLSPGVPRLVYLIDPLLLLLFMSSGRMMYRWWKEERPLAQVIGAGKPVILLASGEEQLLSIVNSFRRSSNWQLAGIMEEGLGAHGRELAGVPILGGWHKLPAMVQKYGVGHVILEDSKLDHNGRRRAYELCEFARVKLLLMPAVDDLMSGKVQMSTMRDVELDDLLGRDRVDLDARGIGELIQDEVILVTGAGGSIGSELCRQIARFNPSLLVLLEHSEFSLYTLEQEFERMFPNTAVRCVVGDVKDVTRLRQVFQRYRPTVVFHAAAYKHVPMMESENAWEAVLNNTLGTMRVADAIAAMQPEYQVKKLVLVSTDKAVNPTSVMGATKRLAEMLLQHWSARTGIQAVIVRFGNVLGSTGSVVPKFKLQISRGGPVTVTHPEMTRYFMSISEACGLILQSALMGESHEIFVLDMGEPVKIVDLARDLIRLSGFSESEIKMEFTGLRPGEKLFEELLGDSERTLPTRHGKIRVAALEPVAGSQWEKTVYQWLNQPGWLSDKEARSGLSRFVPEYKMYEESSKVIPLAALTKQAS
jgi:FlaA1/EpsC-like NDP-sugar epimerase